MSGLEDLGPMPEGWSLKWHGVGNTRRPYFINHETRQTTWDDPRKQRSHNGTPSQIRATGSQSQTSSKQREPAKATLSDEEIMAKAIALSMAEENQRKKQVSTFSSGKWKSDFLIAGFKQPAEANTFSVKSSYNGGCFQ